MRWMPAFLFQPVQINVVIVFWQKRPFSEIQLILKTCNKTNLKTNKKLLSWQRSKFVNNDLQPWISWLTVGARAVGCGKCKMSERKSQLYKGKALCFISLAWKWLFGIFLGSRNVLECSEFYMRCCLEIRNTHPHTYTLAHTHAKCITAITLQRMLGNSVKDVRNVNHLQSVLLCNWSIFPPPGQLKNFDVHSFSLSAMLFICCSWHVTFSGLHLL